MKPYVLSPRKLSLMDDCERCFYRSVNDKIERPSGPFPSLPHGMDLTLKRHYAKHRAAGTLPKELTPLGDVHLFTDEAQLKAWQDKSSALRFTDTDGHSLEGKLDNLLVETDGRLLVLDYKTRSSPPDYKKTEGYYKGQLDIYNLFLEKKGLAVSDRSAIVTYSPVHNNNNGTVLFRATLFTFPVDTKGAYERFRKGINILQGELPAPSDSCGFCAWGERYAKDQMTRRNP